MTKPTIGLLVVITSLPSLIMSSEGFPTISQTCGTLLGIFLASASAAAFNHIIDRDIDAVMIRTKGRPVASGNVPKSYAVTFALVLGFLSLIILGYFGSPLAALIALAANAFYAIVYTAFLKRRTVQNIVIGGAAGAVGPLIGWSAVTNSLSWESWIQFLIIFLWTPPHFWALAIKYRDDYKEAGIPMLPSVKGLEVTRWNILVYSILLLPCVFSLYYFGSAGLLYLFFSGISTLYFVWMAFRLYRSRSTELAMPVFHYSCFYLFAVFGSLVFDRLFV